MNWLRNFMAGRYGIDQLSIALLALYFVLYLIAQLTHFYILAIVAFLLFLICWFRVFSRNTQKRYIENCAFLKYWNPIAAQFRKLKQRSTDRTHRYYKCPKCSNTLRVPRGKGKICITCPVCRTEITKKT